MTTTTTLTGLVALVPLRGGSKGIPGKNLRNLGGRPLFCWCVSAAEQAGVPVVISTESEAIRAAVREHTPAVQLLDRPAELASDTASTESVVAHFLQHVACDHVLLMQATSPLTEAGHVQEAMALYEQQGCRPLVSGTRQHHFGWHDDGTPINYDPRQRPRRQDWPGTFIENGALYLFSRESFLASGSRCAPPCTLYSMPTIHATEIDSLDDWNRLDTLIGRPSLP